MRLDVGPEDRATSASLNGVAAVLPAWHRHIPPQTAAAHPSSRLTAVPAALGTGGMTTLGGTGTSKKKL